MTLVSIGDISSAQVFNNTAGMLSAPHALLGSSFFSGEEMPVSDISIIVI